MSGGSAGQANQDLAAGAMFVLAGVAGLYFGAHHEIGSLARIGPGFAPKVLSIGLIGLGLMIAVKGWRSGVQAELPHLRPIVAILGGLAIFALLVRPLGLVPTTVLSYVFLSEAGGNHRRKEALVVGALFALGLAVVFIYGLNLPLRLFWW